MMKAQKQDNMQNLLMKKSGQALSFLAGEFLKIPAGQRIPTFADLSGRTTFSRGTLQNAMTGLQKLGAIILSQHGTKGTYLIEKKTDVLLRCGGITHINGTMPLPYTKVYEGLATGLFNTINDAGGLVVDIAYVRGSDKRIASVCDGRYDFAVTSRLATKQVVEKAVPIEIAADFGPGSYLSGHSIMFRDSAETVIRDGMRVGVDKTSLDHLKLTELVIGDASVTMVEVNYNQAITLIQKAEIDAVVWNNDNITESRAQVNYQPIEHGEVDDETTAVLVVRADNAAVHAMLDEFLDIESVLRQQREVVDGKRYPNY